MNEMFTLVLRESRGRARSIDLVLFLCQILPISDTIVLSKVLYTDRTIQIYCFFLNNAHLHTSKIKLDTRLSRGWNKKQISFGDL